MRPPIKALPNWSPGRQGSVRPCGSSMTMPGVLEMSQSDTSMMSVTGTVRPTASASRVAMSSFASTRRCCGLFWNFTTQRRLSAPSMSWLWAPPRMRRMDCTAVTGKRRTPFLILVAQSANTCGPVACGLYMSGLQPCADRRAAYLGLPAPAGKPSGGPYALGWYMARLQRATHPGEPVVLMLCASHLQADGVGEGDGHEEIVVGAGGGA